MVTLHEVITFLVSMQISISSLQTHNVNRCGRSRHLARKLLMLRSEERFSRNAETDIVCRLLLEKKNRSFSSACLEQSFVQSVRALFMYYYNVFWYPYSF